MPSDGAVTGQDKISCPEAGEARTGFGLDTFADAAS